MLTPNDIRNATRASGYNHVQVMQSDHKGNGGGKPYRARAGGSHPERASYWQGPRRASAERAAQDYCDYVNGNPSIPMRLKSAGHTGRRTKREVPSDIQAARGMVRDFEAQVAGDVPTYVYLVIEDLPGGGINYGKIGFSTNPQARVAELQTGNPRPLKLLYYMEGTEADERALHAKYAHLNVLQEWFRITKEIILEFPANREKEAA